MGQSGKTRSCSKLKNINIGFRNENETKFPAMLIVNTCNVCNAKCVHCPQPKVIAGRSEDKFPLMVWDTFKKIADEAKDYETLFRFTAFGEPLLHPDAVRMVRYAKEEVDIKNVSLNTNGALLYEEVSEKLLDIGIDVIEVSLDAFKKGTYEKVRRGLNFDVVWKNTHKLVELRDKGSYKTKIFVSIINQPEVKDELDEFVKYWESKVDRVLVRKYLSFSKIMDTDKETEPYYSERIPCPYAWRRMSVGPFGNIRLCIDDWLDKGIIGNIKDTTIHEIWTGPICQEWRKAHLERKFYKIDKCSQCTDWKFHSWDLNYLKALEEVGI